MPALAEWAQSSTWQEREALRALSRGRARGGCGWRGAQLGWPHCQNIQTASAAMHGPATHLSSNDHYTWSYVITARAGNYTTYFTIPTRYVSCKAETSTLWLRVNPQLVYVSRGAVQVKAILRLHNFQRLMKDFEPSLCPAGSKPRWHRGAGREKLLNYKKMSWKVWLGDGWLLAR